MYLWGKWKYYLDSGKWKLKNKVSASTGLFPAQPENLMSLLSAVLGQGIYLILPQYSCLALLETSKRRAERSCFWLWYMDKITWFNTVLSEKKKKSNIFREALLKAALSPLQQYQDRPCCWLGCFSVFTDSPAVSPKSGRDKICIFRSVLLKVGCFTWCSTRDRPGL